MEKYLGKQMSFQTAFSGVNEDRVRQLMETHTWNITLPRTGEQGGNVNVGLHVDASSLLAEGYTQEEIAAAAAVITGAVIMGSNKK